MSHLGGPSLKTITPITWIARLKLGPASCKLQVISGRAALRMGDVCLSNTIVAVFGVNIALFVLPVDHLDQVRDKWRDLTLDQGGVPHYDVGVAGFHNVVLSDNWKRFTFAINQAINRGWWSSRRGVRVMSTKVWAGRRKLPCPLCAKNSCPPSSTQPSTETKSATKLGISHLNSAELPLMT